mgnify:CR=1 FL=1
MLTLIMGKNNALNKEFGVSLAPSTPIIEYPESGIHPAYHGHLADHHLVSFSPTVVITHSDEFILRVRRRIAEKTVSPECVALYWVDENTGVGRRILLNERGTPDYWPEGFFAESQAEFMAIRRALN